MCLHDGGDGGGGVGHAQPEREAARRHGGSRQNLSAAKYDGDYFLVICKLEKTIKLPMIVPHRPGTQDGIRMDRKLGICSVSAACSLHRPIC